jgi:hypothetical protein
MTIKTALFINVSFIRAWFQPVSNELCHHAVAIFGRLDYRPSTTPFCSQLLPKRDTVGPDNRDLHSHSTTSCAVPAILKSRENSNCKTPSRTSTIKARRTTIESPTSSSPCSGMLIP